VALVLACTGPAQAAAPGAGPRATIAPPVLAEFDVSKLFSGASSRSNVVRLCVIVLAAALFIMMKKFEGTEAPSRPFSREAELSERSDPCQGALRSEDSASRLHPES
jgi:hypothetical protein